MTIEFSKFQGTGNDFVMLDNLDGKWDNLSVESIIKLCDRRFGIGADGLIKLNRHEGVDFEVDYYNSDGSKSFCGNGARCAVVFAESLGIDVSSTTFLAIDGVHLASKVGDYVTLNMNDVTEIDSLGNDVMLETGSPHYVRFVDELVRHDIESIGKEIRYSEKFNNQGINVNLVEQLSNDEIAILTYERGVEAETFSCGTGATACAIAFAKKHNKLGETTLRVNVKGGDLLVKFSYLGNDQFTNVQLIGPAIIVFKGVIDV